MSTARPAAKVAFGLFASAFAASVHAQSTVEIYGNVDLGADTVKKTAGVNPALRTNVGRQERLTPSMSTTSILGFRGTEDLGGGWKAGFVLESQPSADTGTLAQDGRMWGRQAFASLTTPYGEIRAGRQYASFFYAKAFSTTERLAGTDLFTGLLTINQLQVRQDNQISYWIKSGFFTGSLSYSPNAGVGAAGINASRAPATSAATAQLLGGSTAGNEGENGRGRSVGGFLNYNDNKLSASVGFHRNDFGVPLYLGTSTAIPLGILDDYKGYVVAARYTFPFDLAIAGAFGGGKYKFQAANPALPELLDDGIELRSWVVGGRYLLGPAGQKNWAVGAMYGEQKFRNFTKGKNKAVVVGADYLFSKRTALFTRYGWLKDDEGDSLAGGILNGGPEPLLVATGLREVPAWNGVGVNPGGKSTVLTIGIRHSF